MTIRDLIFSDDLMDRLAEQAHDSWLAGKRAHGVTSRQSEWGEEFMVPYASLSERAKDLDRATVRGVLQALRAMVEAEGL